MNDQVVSTNENDLQITSSNHSDPNSNVLNIYPLTYYYFGSKQPSYTKKETSADRIHRFKFNFDENGTRTCVQAVILVELFKHPHLLVLQLRNSIYKLPGGSVRQGELEIECLHRKLSRKLCIDDRGCELEWEVGECLGMWWRPDFQTVLYPYLPHNIKRPKECTKLYLVKLPERRNFIVPKKFKLLAVPLCQVHENHKTYGPIIAGVPQLLSRFSFNVISDS